MAGAAALALSWWEGGLSRDQASAHWSVLSVIALVVVGAGVFGAGRQVMFSGAWARAPLSLRHHLAEDPGPSLAAAVWTLLVLAVIGWDLNSFVHQSHNLPTLSSLVGHVTASHVGRAAVFCGWIGLGGVLALGWRRR